MSQRKSGYERKERDLYETPAWVTEAVDGDQRIDVRWSRDAATSYGGRGGG